MEFVPIFEPAPGRKCRLWSADYESSQEAGEGGIDIFQQLFDQWNETEYLASFFKEHQKDLISGYPGMSIDDAIDRVLDEVACFEDELKKIEKTGGDFDSIFQKLHKDEYVLRKSARFQEQADLKHKARPKVKRAMLRLYAIRLEDGCYIVTGGAIKLRDKMDNKYLEDELTRLESVRHFLASDCINSVEGLE